MQLNEFVDLKLSPFDEIIITDVNGNLNKARFLGVWNPTKGTFSVLSHDEGKEQRVNLQVVKTIQRAK